MMLSRVADTLYWMSRHLERAEHTARLLDLHLHLMLDQTPATAAARWDRLFASLWTERPPGVIDAYALTQYLTFDITHENSIVASIASARENARQLREQISSEMWEQVNRMYFGVRSTHLDQIWEDQPHTFFLSIKEGCHLFHGITDSTMNNGQGWRFIQLGRSIERATAIARLMDAHYAAYAETPKNATVDSDFMDWVSLLKSCTAFEAYCKVYTADLRPDCIAEFLLLNAEFPHSIRFAVHQMETALGAIAAETESKRAKTLHRLAGRLRAAVDYGQIHEILDNGMDRFADDIQAQCRQIHDAIYQAYIFYPADEFAF